MTVFQQPANGASCFRRVEAGCWCVGVPSTGALRVALREAGLVNGGALRFPVEDDSSHESGFLALETRDSGDASMRHCLHLIRLW